MTTLPLPSSIDASHARLAGFILLSLALHVLSVLGPGPLNLSFEASSGPAGRTPIQATIVARGDAAATESPAESPPASPAPQSYGNPTTAAPDEGTAATGSARPEAGYAAGTGPSLPAPDQWYRASEVEVRARPLTDVRLRYPDELAGQLTVGRVRLRLFIDEAGVVRKLTIDESEPAGLFDEAARRGWENVRFLPAQRGGVPVKSQKLIELTFQPGHP